MKIAVQSLNQLLKQLLKQRLKQLVCPERYDHEAYRNERSDICRIGQ